MIYEVPIPREISKDDLKLSVSLYYQSIPPAYLSMRFDDAEGEHTKRLHFLASHINLGSVLKDWKLRIGSVEGLPSDSFPVSTKTGDGEEVEKVYNAVLPAEAEKSR